MPRSASSLARSASLLVVPSDQRLVSDRFGMRRTLIACGIVWAVATILTGFAGGFWTLVAARVLLGFGEGATFPAATAAMAR